MKDTDCLTVAARSEKLMQSRGGVGAAQAIAMTQYYAAKAIETVERSARKVIAAVAEGDMLRTQMAICAGLRSTSLRMRSHSDGRSPGTFSTPGILAVGMKGTGCLTVAAR